MIVDVLRSGYTAPARFTTGPGLTLIRWFRAAPNAKLFPYPHAFGSHVWEDSRLEKDQGAGEIGFTRKWSWTGKNPPAGDHFEGKPEWFLTGLPVEELSKPATPNNCGGPTFLPQIGVTLGESVTVPLQVHFPIPVSASLGLVVHVAAELRRTLVVPLRLGILVSVPAQVIAAAPIPLSLGLVAGVPASVWEPAPIALSLGLSATATYNEGEAPRNFTSNDTITFNPLTVALKVEGIGTGAEGSNTMPFCGNGGGGGSYMLSAFILPGSSSMAVVVDAEASWCTYRDPMHITPADGVYAANGQTSNIPGIRSSGGQVADGIGAYGFNGGDGGLGNSTSGGGGGGGGASALGPGDAGGDATLGAPGTGGVHWASGGSGGAGALPGETGLPAGGGGGGGSDSFSGGGAPGLGRVSVTEYLGTP